MDMGKLWAINKKLIDREVPRHTAIPISSSYPLVVAPLKMEDAANEANPERERDE